MFEKKLYVSVTNAAGGWRERGMAHKAKALALFGDFAARREEGKALFMLLSGHDGRIAVRTGAGESAFEIEVVGRAAREPALWGLLPARSEVAVRSASARSEEILTAIEALYTLNREEFARRIAAEAGR